MTDLAQRLRSRALLVGYWVVSDSAAVAERVGLAGYDYVCLDRQHGLIDAAACLRGLIALDAAGCPGLVRVPSHDPGGIGRALDAGAQGVIVPLVDTPAQAAAVVAACRYPPAGMRSYGPTRSSLRIGPDLRAADDAVACVVMIETAAGLANVDAICRTPGVDAIYVGPNDLGIALGATAPAARHCLPAFKAALEAVREAAKSAGIGVGIHCDSGAEAAAALDAGFTFASVSCDLDHLSAHAAAERVAAAEAIAWHVSPTRDESGKAAHGN
jgi:4-hydroxy-2-oxoheptanedioate aldolase